jgi:gamma-glutamyltranspeptidase
MNDCLYFCKINVYIFLLSKLYDLLTDKKIVNEFKSQIKDNGIHPINVYGSSNFVVDHGTAHSSFVAPNGDAVAITSSINLV